MGLPPNTHTGLDGDTPRAQMKRTWVPRSDGLEGQPGLVCVKAAVSIPPTLKKEGVSGLSEPLTRVHQAMDL